MPLKGMLFLHKENPVSAPVVDLYETEEHLVLKMDLPGIDREDVLIKVYEDVLVIEGIRKDRHENRKSRYICMERSRGSFRRMLQIPIMVNTMAGKASYEYGVVTVTFPKIKNRVIRIKIEP